MAPHPEWEKRSSDVTQPRVPLDSDNSAQKLHHSLLQSSFIPPASTYLQVFDSLPQT